MFNCSSIWREAFRLQLLLLQPLIHTWFAWYFCDIYLLVVTISIFLGNIVLLFQTKNKFSEVWLEAWQTKAGHLPCGIGNVFVTQAYKSEYWAVSWPQTKVTFRKAIFYKKAKNWIGNPVLAGSWLHTRGRPTVSSSPDYPSRRLTLSCGTRLEKPVLQLQSLIVALPIDTSGQPELCWQKNLEVEQKYFANQLISWILLGGFCFTAAKLLKERRPKS